ncbi:ATP-binding cassette domain-containing protein [Jiangella anatolica]|uniref:ATP-binding cassette domain-containing protein n=1 Tax=Jiangella anatolica TaxID=2670374 RepID=UPI001F17A681|nr:ATP-binding cassette domain-containing protein [Jiangella anatolica]
MSGSDAALVEVQDVSITYRGGRGLGRRPAPVVDGVTFAVAAGETFGLVGESGSGKSSIARAIAGLHRISGGDIRFRGRSIASDGPGRNREIQMIFQDPDGSLDPRLTIAASVEEALRPSGSSAKARRARAAQLLASVGLREDLHASRPRQLSGGQKQRVAIARALACEPSLLIADEPVSALDVSVQAQVLNLLLDLQDEGLTILLISHDLAVVNHMSDHIGVLSRGRMVEQGSADDVVFRPQNDYTRRLLDAVPGRQLDATRSGAGAEGDPW